MGSGLSITWDAGSLVIESTEIRGTSERRDEKGNVIERTVDVITDGNWSSVIFRLPSKP
jgi:hypothetical protein